MKLVHRMLLRLLPGPFFGWLATLLFLLLMQFLIKYLPDIAGRGLPVGLIVELISYNLAYMVVLAVPMSALLSALMAFSRLSKSQAYAVIKSSGISLVQLLWPTFVVACVLTAGMTYFNNVVLPESNFRARNLWQDVRSKRPDFELQPGIFYEGVRNYSILVRERDPDTHELRDIVIYDYTHGRSGTVIKARAGTLESGGSSVDLVLKEGEAHRLIQSSSVRSKERYERLSFDTYRLRLDLSDFILERSDPKVGYRSDRTTRTGDMIRLVDSLDASVAATQAELHALTEELSAGESAERPPAELDSIPPPIARVAFAGLGRSDGRQLYEHAIGQARAMRTRINDLGRRLKRETTSANRNRVEIQKKFSIALACLIFVFIGAPLGLSIRRGRTGLSVGIALGVFLFFWVALVQGEKLADRGFISPWIGMWFANIFIGLIGLLFLFYVALDLRATPPILVRWKAHRRSA